MYKPNSKQSYLEWTMVSTKNKCCFFSCYRHPFACTRMNAHCMKNRDRNTIHLYVYINTGSRKFSGAENKKNGTREEEEEKTHRSVDTIHTHRTDGSFWKYQHQSVNENIQKKFDVRQGKKYTLVSKRHRNTHTYTQKIGIIFANTGSESEREWKRQKHTWKLTKWIGKNTTQWQDPTNIHRKYAHGINKFLVRWNNKQDGTHTIYKYEFATSKK